MENIEKYLKTQIYAKYLELDVNLNIIPQVVGYEHCMPTKKTVRFLNRPINLMHFVVKGKGYYTIDNHKYEIHEGGIFFCPASASFFYSPDPEDPWEYIWVEFSGVASHTLCKNAGFSQDNPVYYPKNIHPIYKEFFGLLKDSLISGGGSGLLILARLLKLFALLKGERAGESTVSAGKTESFVSDVSDYIANNLHDSELSLKSISSHFPMNPSYLSRVFKETAGVSPIRYIINLRMQKAMTLLKLSTFSIAEIAYIVGYNDPLYFSGKFKQHFTVSPSKARKE